VLYPTFAIALNPMIASAAMALSFVSVITNALKRRERGHYNAIVRTNVTEKDQVE
jgi:cation transport ATPase